MKNNFCRPIVALFIVFCLPAVIFADRKIKQKTTMQGQIMETTVMIKGSRQRTETTIGGDAGKFMPRMATVMQCDLKRNLQINDGKKLYYVDPFASDVDVSGNSSPPPAASAAISQAPKEKGGFVTMTSVITDTGERKQMFGLTARHIKTLMKSEPLPGACQKNKMHIETDGWYVDLPEFSCPVNTPSMDAVRGGMGGSGGCQDKIRYKTSGTGKLGFAINSTTTIFDENGKPQMTMSTETIDFSAATLDAALFDIPSGYAAASSLEELYKMDMTAMMSQAAAAADGGDNAESSQNAGSGRATNNSVEAKPAGMIRVGVLNLSNSTDQQVSAESLRSNLIDDLTAGNVQAIPVSSVEDAKAKSCDFVLSAGITKLKQSAAGKIGGMFGKVTGTDTSAIQKFEVQVDYKLTGADGQSAIQNKVSQKGESNAEAAARTVLSQMAQTVLKFVDKKN